MLRKHKLVRLLSRVALLLLCATNITVGATVISPLEEVDNDDLPTHKAVIKTCLDYTPYTITADGSKQWSGRNIETLFLLTERLGFALDLSLRAPFIRCMKLLEQGKVDVIAGLIDTNERREKFVMIPYFKKDQLAIFYLKSKAKPINIKQLDDTETIGIHRAFGLPDNLLKSDYKQHMVPISSIGTGLLMVLKDRLTGVLAGLNNGQEIIAEWPDLTDKFEYTVLESFGNDSVHFAISPQSVLANHTSEIKQILKVFSDEPKYQYLQLDKKWAANI